MNRASDQPAHLELLRAVASRPKRMQKRTAGIEHLYAEVACGHDNAQCSQFAYGRVHILVGACVPGTFGCSKPRESTCKCAKKRTLISDDYIALPGEGDAAGVPELPCALPIGPKTQKQRPVMAEHLSFKSMFINSTS